MFDAVDSARLCLEVMSGVIAGLAFDREGNLWMGTNGGGVDVLHPDGSYSRAGEPAPA